MGWKLTERADSKVGHSDYEELGPALDALEARGRALATTAPHRAVDLKVRRFEPSERVLARLELSGPQRFVPSVRGGIDIHGDGSVEAFRGHVRRQMIDPRDGESAYAALRRVLSEA